MYGPLLAVGSIVGENDVRISDDMAQSRTS